MVGAGFAGFHAARTLHRRLRGSAEVVLVNPTDYFLYVPLLPEVAGRHPRPAADRGVAAATLPEVRLAVGTVHDIDLPARTVTYRDPDGRDQRLDYDHLLITCGSVNKLLPIPGVSEHAHGFRNLAEAVYLRDHLVRQVELADGTDDEAERTARLTFVVVGAGYTGTEVAAQGVLRHPGHAAQAPAAARPDGALAAAGHRRPGAARAAGAAVARPRPGRWPSAGWRSGPAPRSRRPPPTACCSPTAAWCRPGR